MRVTAEWALTVLLRSLDNMDFGHETVICSFRNSGGCAASVRTTFTAKFQGRSFHKDKEMYKHEHDMWTKSCEKWDGIEGSE